MSASSRAAELSSPAPSPADINRAYRQLCRQRFEALDTEQQYLHQRLASVVSNLTALLNSTRSALAEDWDGFRVDGSPDRADGPELVRIFRQLRRRCAAALSEVRNMASAALTCILAERTGCSEQLPFPAAEDEAIRQANRQRQRGLSGAEVAELPAEARELFARTAWRNVVEGIDMLAAAIDQAGELPESVFAGVCPEEDFGPADLHRLFAALSTTLDLHRAALASDAPAGVLAKVAEPYLEPLSTYLSRELEALGVNVWDAEAAAVDDAGDGLDAAETMVRPVVLEDEPEALYVNVALCS